MSIPHILCTRVCISEVVSMLESKPLEISRRKPSQARSLQTVGVILDAAAQILERQGEDAVTTNAVIFRCGSVAGSASSEASEPPSSASLSPASLEYDVASPASTSAAAA